MFDWLERLTDQLIYFLLGFSRDDKLAAALNFFIYDSVKILILLTIIIFFMGIINSYFPIERIRNFLTARKLYGLEYILASMFGAVTPFCSCSSVPLFIGFVKGGIPLGVTFAFLVTSPLVNEVAVAMFLGLFGFKVTAVYVSAGILLGIASGVILGKLKLEYLLTDWVKEIWKKSEADKSKFSSEKLKLKERLHIIWFDTKTILKSVIVYVIAGIAIGAVMHGYIPEGFFTEYIGSGSWYTVPIAVILGIPMYANAAGVIPVIQVFIAKGIPIGTSLAFMMSVVGLSLPEAILLKKVMTIKLIFIFFGVVGFCIIISGYLFNYTL